LKAPLPTNLYNLHLAGVCWIGLLASSVHALKLFMTSAAQIQIPACRSSMNTCCGWVLLAIADAVLREGVALRPEGVVMHPDLFVDIGTI